MLLTEHHLPFLTYQPPSEMSEQQEKRVRRDKQYKYHSQGLVYNNEIDPLYLQGRTEENILKLATATIFLTCCALIEQDGPK